MAVPPPDVVAISAYRYPVELLGKRRDAEIIHKPVVSVMLVSSVIPLVALATETADPDFVTTLSARFALYDAVTVLDELRNTRPSFVSSVRQLVEVPSPRTTRPAPFPSGQRSAEYFDEEPL